MCGNYIGCASGNSVDVRRSVIPKIEHCCLDILQISIKIDTLSVTGTSGFKTCLSMGTFDGDGLGKNGDTGRTTTLIPCYTNGLGADVREGITWVGIGYTTGEKAVIPRYMPMVNYRRIRY